MIDTSGLELMLLPSLVLQNWRKKWVCEQIGDTRAERAEDCGVSDQTTCDQRFTKRSREPAEV